MQACKSQHPGGSGRRMEGYEASLGDTEEKDKKTERRTEGKKGKKEVREGVKHSYKLSTFNSVLRNQNLRPTP